MLAAKRIKNKIIARQMQFEKLPRLLMISASTQQEQQQYSAREHKWLQGVHISLLGRAQ